MKKNILYLIFLVTFASVAQAQNLKYDKIIEAVNDKNNSQAYTLLLEYQYFKNEFANTYFQLGNIAYEWSFASDPLKDLKQSKYFVYQTNLFYGLCISKLSTQPKDARKNEDYYKTIPEFAKLQTKLDNPIVVSFINKRLEKIKEYEKNAIKISNLFNKLANSYNKTMEIFIFIINNYNNLSSIYIQPKSTLIEKTDELILMYDSTLLYYEQYKMALNNYPIKDYKQKLIPVPINTYRLQGITRTNFYNNEVKIWDFKDWAIKIQTKMNTDIEHFRQTINKTYLELNSKDKKLQTSSKFSNAHKPYILDQKVIFEIEKYDYNSIITSLFEFLDTKIEFLVKYRRNFNDKSNKNSLTLINRMAEFYDLIDLRKSANSMLAQFSEKSTPENYQKHKKFFDNYFKEISGIDRFTTKQKKDIQDKIENTIENLKFFTVRDIFYKQITNSQTADYKQYKINLCVSKTAPEDAVPNTYYTVDVADFRTSKYVAGYYKIAQKFVPFIAKIKDNNVEWLNTYPSANSYVAKIQAFAGGCYAVIHSDANNILIGVADNSKQNFNMKINNKNIPRSFVYDEINSNAVIAFQGDNINYYLDNSSSLDIQKVNILEKNIEWEKNINLSGKLIDIIKIDGDYHFITNFSKLQIDSKSFSATSSNNIMNMKIDINGNFIEATQLQNTKFIWGLSAQKINNNTIAIIGLSAKTDIYSTNFNQLPKANVVFFSPNNLIYFQN